MHIGAWIPLQRLFHQRRFANLMEVYERNYGLLLRMAPQLPWDDVERQVCGWAGPLLYLEVTERHRYTTDIRLTHYLPAADHDEARQALQAAPDLLLRACHDSRQLELLGRDGRLSRCWSMRLDGIKALDRRWAANLFLERWLTYCLNQGYCFAPRRAATAGRRSTASAQQ